MHRALLTQAAKESAAEEQKRLLEEMSQKVRQNSFYMKRAMVRARSPLPPPPLRVSHARASPLAG